MRALAKKHADLRTRPQMLQQAFNMAEEASRRILETESFERSSTVRFMGSVNNIYQCESEVNEVSRGRYNNNNYKGGYNKGNNYKGKNDYYGKKDWNKNTKGSYQKKEDKKESKDKDVYLTLTKDVKFHCPAGFDENIFACTCKMIQEKVTMLDKQVLLTSKPSMLSKKTISCMSSISQKMCMTLHGPRQQVRRILVHQGIPPIDYRRVTHQKTI